MTAKLISGSACFEPISKSALLSFYIWGERGQAKFGWNTRIFSDATALVLCMQGTT